MTWIACSTLFTKKKGSTNILKNISSVLKLHITSYAVAAALQ